MRETRRRFPSRETTIPQPVALVCSGGGVYGAAQAGMLAELMDAGFRPDMIIGVSAGAMNGAFLAKTWTPERCQELLDIWTSVERKEVFPSGLVSQAFKLVAGRDALQSAKGMRALVDRFAPARLEECEIPVHVGATDLVTGSVSWWSEGESAPRLCASAALPGVVPPVLVDGRAHVDGGVVANVPLARAVELGAMRVVCLDVSTVEKDYGVPDSALAVLLRAFAHTRHHLQVHQMERVAEATTLHHLTPHLPAVGVADFSRASELIEIGRTTVREALEKDPSIVAQASQDDVGQLLWGGALRQRLGRAMRSPSRVPMSAPAAAPILHEG